MPITYIYGPPASGKLTVAKILQELTGYPLFHNHLTVDAISSVFAFGSEAFTDVLRRWRLDVFETAARTETGMIFTNNSAWGAPNGRARFASFAAEARSLVESNGGRTVFVQLHAPPSVLEERIAHESRRAHGKLLDVNRLRELLADHDDAPLHVDDLIINTALVDPSTAATAIAERLQ